MLFWGRYYQSIPFFFILHHFCCFPMYALNFLTTFLKAPNESSRVFLCVCVWSDHDLIKATVTKGSFQQPLSSAAGQDTPSGVDVTVTVCSWPNSARLDFMVSEGRDFMIHWRLASALQSHFTQCQGAGGWTWKSHYTVLTGPEQETCSG